MTVVTIQASANITDTNIRSATPTLNASTDAGIYIGELNTGANVTRGLIKFDLSSIPANATISSAVLSIKAINDYCDNARTWRVYRVLRAWVGSQVTWNVYSTGNDWGTAGCSNTSTDREATDIGTRDFSAAETVPEFKNFSLTASKIQEMTAGTFTNNGFLIQVDTESDDSYNFASSENGTEADNPKLVITYTLPGGGFFALL
jgi:hypothetical protein